MIIILVYLLPLQNNDDSKNKILFWIVLSSPLIVKAKDEFSDDSDPTEVLIDEFASTIQLAHELSTQLENKVTEAPANKEAVTLAAELNDMTNEMSSVMSGASLELLNQEGMKLILMVQNKQTK